MDPNGFGFVFLACVYIVSLRSIWQLEGYSSLQTVGWVGTVCAYVLYG